MGNAQQLEREAGRVVNRNRLDEILKSNPKFRYLLQCYINKMAIEYINFVPNMYLSFGEILNECFGPIKYINDDIRDIITEINTIFDIHMNDTAKLFRNYPYVPNHLQVSNVYGKTKKRRRRRRKSKF